MADRPERPDLHLPVRPDLEQLRRQAKELKRAIHVGDAEALERLNRHHPHGIEPTAVKLADAQLVLARSYGLPSWPRLKLACDLIKAICEDDVDAVRDLVRRYPRLLDESARGVPGNWGPPMGKHRCLELFAEHGIELPDTPPMAGHRSRLDLLERHLTRDPDLLFRTFAHRQIYPPELGCSEDETLALHSTPLAGGTLLHLAVDNDEVELIEWMLETGADPDSPAAVDGDGFGGHTALFGCVVSQTHRVGLRRDDGLARLLLDHGADPAVRASLRKRLRFVEDESWHEYHDVTPLEWGERFHDKSWVNTAALEMIRRRT